MNHEQESHEHQEFEKHQLQDIVDKIDTLHERIELLDAKVTPVVDWFKNLTFAKSAMMWLLGLVAAIGGLIIMFRDIFSKH